MPRSFQKRRGKPRLETQYDIADVENNNKKKQSQLQKIKDIEGNGRNDTGDGNKSDEEEHEKKMWSHLKVSKEDPCDAPLVTSEFSTKYPQQRENYIRLCYSKIRSKLQEYGVNFQVNYSDAIMTVSTTNKTWDPYAIIKARDLIRLLARYVQYEQAIKIMNDDVYCDVIEMGKASLASNQLRFIKRRARLIGPNGVTLRAIELLTKCYILVYGRTVCVMGSIKGIQAVRKIVIDCMNNIHPIYALKRLMVMKELQSNPNVKNESWNRFLPVFKKIRRDKASSIGGNNHSMITGGHVTKTISQIRKKQNKKKNKKYTPWPPGPTPSKIDIAMENGSYWNKSWRNENLKRKTKEEKLQNYQNEKDLENRERIIQQKKQEKEFIQKRKMRVIEPPPEIPSEVTRKRLQSASV